MLAQLRRRALQRGEFNWVIVAFLLGFAAVIYVAAIFVPPWARNRRVAASMREAVFQSWRYKGKDDQIKKVILDKRKDNFGAEPDPAGEKPYFEQTDIFITRDETEGLITIELAYTVTIAYPFLEKTREVEYELSETGSMLSPALDDKKKGKGMLEKLLE